MNLIVFMISICFIPFIPSLIIFCLVMTEVIYKQITQLFKKYKY